MNKRTDKAVETRMIEAQANIVDVAATLGITAPELKVIQAYVEVINKRIAALPITLITAEGETHIRTRFPNNEKAIKELDPNEMEDQAMKFVEDAAFGFPVGNLRKDAPVDKAKRDFHNASQRVAASPADPEREVGYAKSLFWLGKMRVQQQLKDALGPVFEMVHHTRRGYRYIAPDQTVNAVPADETLKNLMA